MQTGYYKVGGRRPPLQLTLTGGPQLICRREYGCPNYNLVLGPNTCVAWGSLSLRERDGAERRVRVCACWPSSGPFLEASPIGLALRPATFSRSEKDTPAGFFANLDKY